MFLLDTSICISLLRKHPAKVLERLMACLPENVALSVVTLSQLAYGVSQSQAQQKNREALELFLSPFQVLDYPQKQPSPMGTSGPSSRGKERLSGGWT